MGAFCIETAAMERRSVMDRFIMRLSDNYLDKQVEEILENIPDGQKTQFVKCAIVDYWKSLNSGRIPEREMIRSLVREVLEEISSDDRKTVSVMHQIPDTSSREETQSLMDTFLTGF